MTAPAMTEDESRPAAKPAMTPGIVVIGRNEGERLLACLASLPEGVPVVYVDSGSTDGSPEAALAADAELVRLDLTVPFTAGRARNEGFRRLKTLHSEVDAVQFLDGDTVLRPGWLERGLAFLAAHPDAVAVAGRRREKAPEASWYNTLCDREWDTPIGEAAAVGGDALYRADAFEAAGGFAPTVIAGEEPELCLRLRRGGGTVHRLDEEMTLHDAAIHRFGAWWRRAERSGYAYALGALMHGRSGYNVKETARAALWGAVLPIAALVGLLTGLWPVAGLILLLYVSKWLRLRMRLSDQPSAGRYAFFLMLANIAEVGGIARCLADSLKGKRQILEYK